MADQKATDAEIIAAFEKFGSPRRVAEYLGISERVAYTRRNKLVGKGLDLPSFSAAQNSIANAATVIPHNRRILTHQIENGTIVVGSDAHYWPGEPTVAHRAFVEVIKQLKPNAVILNGDVLDGARISRHDPLFGMESPTVKQEIEVCQERLGEIENASKNSTKFFLYGNHDLRLWRYIQVNAMELQGIKGTDLFEYFPGWNHGWRLDVNDSVIVKHRWHSGVHAGWNNAMKGFLKTNQGTAAIVTGHLHRLLCTPFRGVAGVAWGVDCGTLADISGDQFRYMEESPTQGASGFVVLTFVNGMLTPPELCEVINGAAYFRGKEICRQA